MDVETFLKSVRSHEPSMKASIEQWLEVDRLRSENQTKDRTASLSYADGFRFRKFFQQKAGQA